MGLKKLSEKIFTWRVVVIMNERAALMTRAGDDILRDEKTRE